MTDERKQKMSRDDVLERSLAQPGVAEAMEFWRITRGGSSESWRRGERSGSSDAHPLEADAQLG